MAKRDGRGVAEALKAAALRLPDVAEGGACTKLAYGARGKNFLFVGTAGEVVTVMVKLAESLAEARALAASEPGRYTAGAGGWVKATVAAGEGASSAVLVRWAEESYRVVVGGAEGTTRAAGAKPGGGRPAARAR